MRRPYPPSRMPTAFCPPSTEQPCLAGARRAWRWASGAVLAVLLTGCTTTSLVLGVVGVATDTSITWEVAKHFYAKLTEGDPAPCFQLNSVQHALSPRCGAFTPGTIKTADLAHSGFQECPLSVAIYDKRLWPVLPELLEKGAKPEHCHHAPLVVMAQVHGCPAFERSPPELLQAVNTLARSDARSVHHDVVRMLSCPSARQAGLHHALQAQLDAGQLKPQSLPFGMLGALHPDYLHSDFARRLQAQGHTARAALGPQGARLPSGFEEALRTSHWAALDWWLTQLPELRDRVPPAQAGQLPWVPLARVLSPQFMANPAQQGEALKYLLARGADPWQAMPQRPGQSVVAYARWLQSPHVALLDPQPLAAPRPSKPAAGAATLQVARVGEPEGR
jgi:hypothetical protein